MVITEKTIGDEKINTYFNLVSEEKKKVLNMSYSNINLCAWKDL